MQEVTLIPKEIVFPRVHTLDSTLIEPYNEGVKRFLSPLSGSLNERVSQSLNIFSNQNGELAGSNCFAPILLRDYLPEGTKLATMADLGKATEQDTGFLRGFFSDTGLTLRTAGDSYSANNFLAKDLASQLKKRGIDLKNPKVIYFDALSLRADSHSAYGLAYDINEEAKLGENIIDAPELKENSRFITMNGKGIPVKDSEGRRDLYTRSDGLSRFFLNWYSLVGSDSGDLAVSSGDGRVVGVSAEGASQNFDGYLANLQKVKDEEIAKINERYQQAEAILRGE